MSDSVMSRLAADAPTALHSSGETLPASASCLPIELVLHILELLTIEIRDSIRAEAVSLSLVSRAVRQSVLPLLYEVLVLRITGSGTDVIGWNGRRFDNKRLSFLSWLLNNPSAPPRQYIKQIVFHHSYMFSGRDLGDREDDDGSDSESEPNTPSEWRWTIDDLIVTFPSDSTQLRAAAIKVGRVHWLTLYAPENHMDSLSTRAHLAGDALREEDPFARNCLRFWTEKIETPGKDKKSRVWTGLLQYQEIDQERGVAGRIASPNMQGVHIFIDVGVRDGFGEVSSLLIEEIVSVLAADKDGVCQVVLVFSWDAPGDDLHEAARALCVNRERLMVKSLERVWLARSTWPDRSLMRSDPQTALARVIRMGSDPWHMGCQLSEFTFQENLLRPQV